MMVDKEKEAYQIIKHYLCSECRDYFDFLLEKKG